MDTQVILDELDNMIARVEHEKAIHRFRIDAMPRCPARESDERRFRQMDLQLYRLRCFRSGLTAKRRPGALLH